MVACDHSTRMDQWLARCVVAYLPKWARATLDRAGSGLGVNTEDSGQKLSGSALAEPSRVMTLATQLPGLFASNMVICFHAVWYGSLECEFIGMKCG